ncbi:spartin [Carabus blaptoides fortunei]
MGNAESTQWSQVYNSIKQTHDAAYAAIDQAIKLEEEEMPYEATEKYKSGIALIDQALSIQIEYPSNPDLTWEKARVMIQKMKKTRAEVLTRINSIQSADEFVAPVPPPSYDEAMSSSTSTCSDRPRTYSELASALETMQIDETNRVAQLIFMHDNVQLYFISPDGTVSSSAELQTLKIGVVQGVVEGEESTTFIQIGEWVYPLVPGVSPCYRTDYGAFILPDLQADIPGSSVGIILPADCDSQVYELLEDILHGIIREEVPLQPKAARARRAAAAGVSGSISNGIVTGAFYIQQGLIKGAEKAGDLMNYGAPKIMSRVRPAHEPKPIPSKVQRGFAIAQDVTYTAANVTGFVANKVGLATMALGRYLAPHIQKQGTRLLTTGFKMSEHEASDKMNGVLTVAAGAVEGFATVYKGLESSASILGNNLTNNTVKIVEHKYGRPSGVLAGNTLYTVGNVWSVSQNITYITPKGLAKHAVKNTGKAIVEDIRQELRPGPSGQLYTNIQQAGPSTSSRVPSMPKQPLNDQK